MRPKEFFDSNPRDLEQVAKVVRAGFGRNLDSQDIYDHITKPEEVYLLRNGDIKAMASYNFKTFCGYDAQIVEGVALLPEIQGKKLFGKMSYAACRGENIICLRTQNPRMYAALENYCLEVYPGKKDMPKEIRAIQEEFAAHLGCKIDENGVIKRYYGGLFYGEEPTHCKASKFLKEKLKMDLSKGDAVLLVSKRIPTMSSEDHDIAMGLI